MFEAEGEDGFWLIKDEDAMADSLDPMKTRTCLPLSSR